MCSSSSSSRARGVARRCARLDACLPACLQPALPLPGMQVEAVDVCAGTTYFFPCEQWVKGSGPGASMPRSLQLRGYTTDPASLPVQYRLQAAVEEVAGRPAADSLRLVLCGSRGESAAQRLDASRAAAGRTLTCLFEADNVGQVERVRIGLAAGQGGEHRSPLRRRPSAPCMPWSAASWRHACPPCCPPCRARRPGVRRAPVVPHPHQHAQRRVRHLPLPGVAAQRRPIRSRAGCCRGAGGTRGGGEGGDRAGMGCSRKFARLCDSAVGAIAGRGGAGAVNRG